MDYKKVDIIYGQSLKQVQGINYVNNAFVQGAKYFKADGFYLRNIISPFEVFECGDCDRLNLIGIDADTKGFKRKRKLRVFLKKRCFPKKSLIASAIRFYLTFLFPAYKAAKKYVNFDDKADYLIFQDIFSAYFYFKLHPTYNSKCLLILHCSYTAFEQLELIYPVLFQYEFILKWIRSIERFVESKIDRIVYLSKRAMNASSWDKIKLSYVYNGIENSINHINTPCHYPLNICCVGSMDGRKGQDILIEAMAKIESISPNSCLLHLVGGGILQNELMKLATDLGVSRNVKFYGVRNDVPAILEQMDIFILPSKSEGMPMSMIEAMRQGMFIMGTDTGGIPEMITPDFGMLIKRDSDDIASKIISIMKSKLITEELKLSARDYYIKNFTLSVMISRYSRILQSLK